MTGRASRLVRAVGERRLVRWRRANRRALSLQGKRRLIAMMGCAFYLGSALDAAAARWSVVYDPQQQRCLEGVSWLIVDKADHAIERGDIYAFVPPDRVAQFYPDGVLMAKRVMGLPGDIVEVTAEATRVNGVVVAEGLAMLALLQARVEDYARRFVVPAGHMLMMGDTPDSFDGRYWGTLPIERGVGRAEVIL